VHQSLAASGAYDLEAFAIDGVQYLVVANYYDVSIALNIDSKAYIGC
jgi:hypothetical protein